MRKVIKGIAIVFIAVILIIIGVALFALWPEGEARSPRPNTDMDITSILTDAIDPSTIKVDLVSASLRMDMNIDDTTLNNAISAVIKDNKTLTDEYKLTAYQAWIRDGFLRFKANVTIGGFLPVQITIDAKPSITDKLHLEITGAKLGRMPISTDVLLQYMGIDNGVLSMDVPGMIQGMKLENLTVEQGKMHAEASVTVRTMDEFTSLAQGLGPRVGQYLYEAVQEAIPAISQ